MEREVYFRKFFRMSIVSCFFAVLFVFSGVYFGLWVLGMLIIDDFGEVRVYLGFELSSIDVIIYVFFCLVT